MKISLYKSLILLIAIVFSFYQLNAEDAEIQKIREKLPKMLGANNVGNDFWITFNPCDETSDVQNDVRVFVSSPVRTLVTVYIPRHDYLRIQYTVPNDVIEFRIPSGIAQCYQKKEPDPPKEEQVYSGAGIHVYAEDLIVVYGLTRFKYTSDGFLALPVSSLGKEYIAASYADPSLSGVWLPSEIGIVAPYDNTKVKFTLGGTVATKTYGGMKPGQTKEYTLKKGDVLLFAGAGVQGDLSGSKIVSNKAVGVLSGNYCAFVPSDKWACDFITEMELPTYTWGKDYHVTPMFGRKKNSIIKIFAKEAKTKIFRDGLNIGTIKLAGGTEGDGWFHMRADDGVPRPIVISGDKGISVTQFNPGIEDDDVDSDPFQLILTPLEQYQNEIVFNTPGIKGGAGYPDNYLNICYEADEDGLMPEDLQFAQVVNGNFAFRAIKDIDPSFGQEFKYKVNNKTYYSKTFLLPGDGVYKIRASRPFTAYAYGFSWCDSYGFPTSVALMDLRNDTLCPVPKYIVNCDGNVLGAVVTDYPDDDTVRTNLSLIVFDNEKSSNFKFQYEDFTPGETRTTGWQLKIIDNTKDAVGFITFTDRKGNDTTIKVEYYATKLRITPNKLDLGLMPKDAEKTVDFVAENYSDKSTPILKDLKLKYDNQNFSLVYNLSDLPRALAPGEKYPFKVTFKALANGSFKDSIGLGDTCLFFWNAEVKAMVGEAQIDVSDINFGDRTIGTSTTDKFFIRNNGTTDLIITGYDGPQQSTIYTHDIPVIDASNPLIIPAGGYQEYSVTFKPTDVIYYPDKITFFNNAKITDSVAVLNGHGMRSDLLANSYNWDRKRIDRTGFTGDGPYPAPAGIIKLVNGGNDKVTINGLKDISMIGSSDAFEFDYGNNGTYEVFNATKFNYEVPANGEINIPVRFHPTEVGKYELKFKYNNTANSETETTLQGVGILPRVSTIDYTFGMTTLGKIASAQNRTIRFTNVAWQDKDGTDVSDSLTITDFTTVLGVISFDGNNYSTDGFMMNKGAISFPIVLQPGQSYDFDASYFGQSVGTHTVKLQSKSDAETEAVTTWTGETNKLGINGKGDKSKLCINQKDTLVVTIENTGDDAIEVSDVEFSPEVPEFYFLAGELRQFSIAAKGYHLIKVVYEPTTTGTHTTSLLVHNNVPDKDSVYKVPDANGNNNPTLTGEAVHYTLKTSTTISNREPNIGESANCQILLDMNGTDGTFAQLAELTYTVTFNKCFLGVSNVSLGSLVNNGNFELVNSVINHSAGYFSGTIRAKNKTSFITSGGELISFKLTAYLPSICAEDPAVVPSKIEPTFVVTGWTPVCVDVENYNDSLKLVGGCVYDIRWIVSSGVNYKFNEINPNPVGSTGGKFEYSVGLDAFTDISIYDAMGRLVSQPVAGVLQPGEYSSPIPVEQLSSGMYICVMTSGPFRQTRTLVISK